MSSHSRSNPTGDPAELSRYSARLRTVRVGKWRNDTHVALVSPRLGEVAVDSEELDELSERAGQFGLDAIITTALNPIQAKPFASCGYNLKEELHLLRHDLGGLANQVGGALNLRRPRQPEFPMLLALDNRAFPPFWRLDSTSLQQTINATTSARFRVATNNGLHGYAITGRSGPTGYLQRLAVDPQHQGVGIGSALVLDGLRWLRRWRVQSCYVNTQLENDKARRLYEHLGFQLETQRLAVLVRWTNPQGTSRALD